jgi:hypothetical protein
MWRNLKACSWFNFNTALIRRLRIEACKTLSQGSILQDFVHFATLWPSNGQASELPKIERNEPSVDDGLSYTSWFAEVSFAGGGLATYETAFHVIMMRHFL